MARRLKPSALAGVKAVAFDAYGTIIDFGEKDFIATFAEIMAHQGLQGDAGELWRRFLRAAYRLRNENHEHPSYHRFVDAWARQFHEAFSQMGLAGEPREAALYLRHKLAQAPVHPEAPEVLARVRSRYRVALLSNADDDFLRECLQRNHLSFELVVTSEGARALKPDPAIFLHLVRALDLEPPDVVYVGDNPLPDILGAKRAGLRAVWLDRLGRRRPRRVPPPDLKIKSLRHLLPALGLGNE